MQASFQLYPTVSFPDGNRFKCAIDILVPNMTSKIAVEKVHLVGKKLFVLWKIQSSSLEAMGRVRAKQIVLLPKEVNSSEIKVYHLMLGKKWVWTDPSYEGMIFINSESDYNKAMGIK